METIQELRELLQREKLEGRERPWGYRLFQRGPSIYITIALMRTPLTPNGASLASILFGASGALLLLYPAWEIKLAALLLFYFHLLFDRVDGELARYKHVFSLKGIYLDELNHYIIPPLFFICLAWGLKDTTASEQYIVLLAGMGAGFASILLRLTHNIPYGIYCKKFIKSRALLPLPPAGPTITGMRAEYSLLYPTIRFIHQFQDFFITIVLFMLAFIMEHYFAKSSFLYPYSSLLLFGYAAYLPLVVLENVIKGIRTIESKIRELDI
jgi:phosphatidylglycerophosphate synthase